MSSTDRNTVLDPGLLGIFTRLNEASAFSSRSESHLKFIPWIVSRCGMATVKIIAMQNLLLKNSTNPLQICTVFVHRFHSTESVHKYSTEATSVSYEEVLRD